ncbi:MAG: glycosyltransferase family A protein [Bacteroidota bacterium]|nr:glycosyltransferase family A protein [Bacteroidota bacterium]
MSSTPLVSCVMVTADRHDLCRRAIRSYAAQTWTNRQLVVLDNGVEPMESLLQDLPYGEVVYRHVPNNPDTTIGELRNRSLEMVTGDFVVPQWDDDDWSAPDRIEQQIGALEKYSADAVTLYATLMHVDDPEWFDHPFYGLLKGGVPPTILHRRDDEVRFPELRRTSDTTYKHAWMERTYHIMPMREAGHLHLRYSHGGNLWEQEHFLRRMRNTPADLLAYGWHKFVRRNVLGHPRFRITDEARAAFETYLAHSRECGLFESEAS